MNQGAFLIKGLDNVRAEFSLTALVFNLRRALNILGVEAMMAAARGRREARYWQNRPTWTTIASSTAGILRQNAQTSLKGASRICHRSDGAVSTRSVRILLDA